MFEQIVVPLDGSTQAEQALPVAARLARGSQGTIVLVQAVSIPPEYALYLYSEAVAQTPFFAQQVLDAQEAKASEYLSGIAASELLQGIKTQTCIRVGAADTIILNVAREQKADVIVMCRHGAGGLQHWLLGSVAQKVVRHCSIPVLLLHKDMSLPTSPSPDSSPLPRSLFGAVALDGSELAEAALLPAAFLIAALAAPARGSLFLTRVVKLVEDQPAAQKRMFSEAETYLSCVAERLSSPSGPLAELDLSISWAATVGQDVAETLLTMAEHGEGVEKLKTAGGCDVIAMATHGRGGVQRWLLGSVTERVLSTSRLPLLIVRPEAALANEGEKR